MYSVFALLQASLVILVLVLSNNKKSYNNGGELNTTSWYSILEYKAQEIYPVTLLGQPNHSTVFFCFCLIFFDVFICFLKAPHKNLLYHKPFDL